MIVFTALCFIFVISVLTLITITIIIDKFDNFKAHTYSVLMIISRWLVRFIILSFFGIGICCFIALLKWIFCFIRG